MTAGWSAGTEEHLAEGRGGEARQLGKQLWARTKGCQHWNLRLTRSAPVLAGCHLTPGESTPLIGKKLLGVLW